MANRKKPVTYCKSYAYGKLNTNDSKTFTYGSAWRYTLAHHQAAAATCTTKGNVEYVSHSVCKNLF
ncbi:hypothetical protein AALC17_12225 [Oscillospiraceae bacterium 38-13]